MWFDETEAINVLAKQQPEEGSSSPTYVVFRQTKYALPGETLAILGCIIEPGEEPLAAAKRELLEELGMKASAWVPLGNYRVWVNRG